MTRYAWIAPACVALAVVACGTSPAPTYYSLSAEVPGAAPATTSRAARRIVIQSTSIPDSVDRPQIVVRTSDGGVNLNEFQRWDEPLRSGIARTVAAQLSRDLGGAEVWPSPSAAPAEADARVLLEVARFDSTLGDSVQVEVLWTVRRGQTETTGRSFAREPVADATYGALVAAHRKALAAVSRDLAAAIQTPAR